MNREEIIKNYQYQLSKERREALLKNKSAIEAFKAHCLELDITLDDSHINYRRKLGIVVTFENLVAKLDPLIQRNHEGMVNFMDLQNRYQSKRFLEGSLIGTNYILFASHFFRRGLHENSKFAPRFIEYFWKQDFKQTEAFIALDFDRVRIDLEGPLLLELDTWFGASFQADIDLIKDGVTQLRPPQYIDDFDNQFLFNSAYSLDIMWYSYDNIKVFQALEFKTDEVTIELNGKSYFPVRYVHAEYDKQSRSFRHFDGALQLYSEHQYFERRDKNFNEKIKGGYQIKTKSQKLFKINGYCSVDDWVKFTSHFFAQNPLILEYFEGEYPEHLKLSLDAIRKDLGINDSNPVIKP